MIVPPPSVHLLNKFKEFLNDPEVSEVLRDLAFSAQTSHPDNPLEQDWQQINQYAHVHGYHQFYKELYEMIPAFEDSIRMASHERKPRATSQTPDEEEELSRKLTY